MESNTSPISRVVSSSADANFFHTDFDIRPLKKGSRVEELSAMAVTTTELIRAPCAGKYRSNNTWGNCEVGKDCSSHAAPVFFLLLVGY